MRPGDPVGGGEGQSPPASVLIHTMAPLSLPPLPLPPSSPTPLCPLILAIHLPPPRLPLSRAVSSLGTHPSASLAQDALPLLTMGNGSQKGGGVSRLQDQLSAAGAAQPVLAPSSEAELPSSSLMLECPLAWGVAFQGTAPGNQLLSLPGKEGAQPLQASSVSRSCISVV